MATYAEKKTKNFRGQKNWRISVKFMTKRKLEKQKPHQKNCKVTPEKLEIESQGFFPPIFSSFLKHMRKKLEIRKSPDT
jgi:hypothetical protein